MNVFYDYGHLNVLNGTFWMLRVGSFLRQLCGCRDGPVDEGAHRWYGGTVLYAIHIGLCTLRTTPCTLNTAQPRCQRIILYLDYLFSVIVSSTNLIHVDCCKSIENQFLCQVFDVSLTAEQVRDLYPSVVVQDKETITAVANVDETAGLSALAVG